MKAIFIILISVIIFGEIFINLHIRFEEQFRKFYLLKKITISFTPYGQEREAGKPYLTSTLVPPARVLTPRSGKPDHKALAPRSGNPDQMVQQSPTKNIPLTVMFYHIATIGNWKEIVKNQLFQIFDSGLTKSLSEIRIGILGDLSSISFFNYTILPWFKNISGFSSIKIAFNFFQS